MTVVGETQTTYTQPDAFEATVTSCMADPRFQRALYLALDGAILNSNNVLADLKQRYTVAQETGDESAISSLQNTVTTAVIMHGITPVEPIADRVLARLAHED